jgi:serine/threonine protein kinase
MRYAKRSDGTPVVVKLHHRGSDELRILQQLHSIKLPNNPAIPLIETLELNLGTFIILPTASPLDLELTLGTYQSSTVVDLSRQLIAGVGFLHRHGIAHLDIKPGNLVVLRNQLFIIDFDISVCVNDPDALINRWCGTPRWMAPEIGHEDGPRTSYSPIRADLWSCGQTIKYLADEGGVIENPFEALTKQLLSMDPQRRPLLHLDSVGYLLSEPRVALKQKAGAHPPVVKRPAYTVHT